MHFSQATLGSVSGLPRTYISEVERGLRNVSLVTAEKLARALEIPTRDLLDQTVPVAETTPSDPVSALAPGWKSECLARAKTHTDFTLLFTTPENASFMKDLARQFGYVCVKCDSAVVMVCLDRPPAPH